MVAKIDINAPKTLKKLRTNMSENWKKLRTASLKRFTDSEKGVYFDSLTFEKS